MHRTYFCFNCVKLLEHVCADNWYIYPLSYLQGQKTAKLLITKGCFVEWQIILRDKQVSLIPTGFQQNGFRPLDKPFCWTIQTYIPRYVYKEEINLLSTFDSHGRNIVACRKPSERCSQALWWLDGMDTEDLFFSLLKATLHTFHSMVYCIP